MSNCKCCNCDNYQQRKCNLKVAKQMEDSCKKEESAFDKWQNKNRYIRRSWDDELRDIVKRERKAAWNAAIDAVLNAIKPMVLAEVTIKKLKTQNNN